MLTALKDLFARRSSIGVLRGSSRACYGRRLQRARALRGSVCQRSRSEVTAPAEQLEPRLALTVGFFESPGTVFVHVDNTNDSSQVYLKPTESGDLLVSDNSGFFNAGVVDNIGNYGNLLVFSGSSRLDDVLDPLEWWMLSQADESPKTGLHLTGDNQMYAYGLIENEFQGDFPGQNIRSFTFNNYSPSSPTAEVFGTISYTQSDGTVSRWYFSNYNTDTAQFDRRRVKITAGPGVAPEGQSAVNQANRNNPDLFVPVTDLVEGHNFPVSVEIVQGVERWDRRLEVTWNARPAEAPVITATYPVTDLSVTDTTNSGGGGLGGTGVDRVVAYTDLHQITRSGALSRGDLGYRLAGAYSTGYGGDSASVGRLPGFFNSRLDIPTTHRLWDNEDQAAFVNGLDGVIKPGASAAVDVGASLDPATLVEQFTNNPQAITPLSNQSGSIDINAVFNAGTRDASWSLTTSVTHAPAGFDRSFTFSGINVHRGAAPQMLDTRYLTWTKDGAADVTFAPGPELFFNDITIELTSPGSTVNINSPIASNVLDIRSTNVVVNAQATVGGSLYVGRSTQLEDAGGIDRPRLTLSQNYGDTPVMQPDNWVVEGVEPIFAPVFGPNGSIAALEIPAGGEGYGYDPNTSPVISVAAPSPQQAAVEVIGVSGSLASLTVQSKGSGLTNGFYTLTASENQMYSMVQKITFGGSYDYFGGGPVVADAVPLVVVDKPTLASDDDRIGYGEAAIAESGWTAGVTQVQAAAVTRTITWVQGQPAPPATIQADFTVNPGDTGLIRQPATVNSITITGNVVPNAQGGGGKATYTFPGGTYKAATYGSGYDPSRSYGGIVDLGGGVTSPLTVAGSAFKEGILAASVTDGGLNYDPEEAVGVHVITELAATGVALQAGYAPALNAELADRSSFFGDEITLTTVTSQQTGDRDMLEYLFVGMPLRGPGFSSEATIAGIDYSSGIVSVSVGGITSPALLGDAKFYPHEYYVENQPALEAIQGLSAAVTLVKDVALFEAEVNNNQLMAVSIVDPPDNPYDGEFPGRRGGSGYQIVPDFFPIFVNAPGLVGNNGIVPTVVGAITGEIAEAEVRVPGSNYLATEPSREGVMDVEVYGGSGDGLLRLDVSGGRLTGRGDIVTRGSGFQSAGVAIENVPEPDDFLPGQGLPAEFVAVVEPDGTIRETIRISGGSEYVVTPGVFIESPLTISAAQAAANVDLVSQEVTSIDVQVAGSGYTQQPSVTITPPGPDGVGRQALAIAVIESGKIKEIRIVDPGSGYTEQPQVFIASPLDPAVVETMQVNADLVVDGVAELYVADERSTTEPRRGAIGISSQTTLGSTNLNTLYVEARASDILNRGIIETSPTGNVQVQLVSPAVEQFGGPFVFVSEGDKSLRANNLVIGLENQSDFSGESSYRHTVSLDTEINSLRVATAIDSNTGSAAPYSISINEEDNLTVDAVLRAGGDIAFAVGGSLSIESSLLTDAGVDITADSFTVRSPVVSQQGPIRIETTSNALSVLNGLTVESPQRNPLVNDIELVGAGGVTIQGEVTSLNNIRIESGQGVNNGVAITNTSLISTAGDLAITANDDVGVRTAVTNADIRAPGSAVTLVEADDIHVDIQADRVNLVAMGVDPGVYGVNANALEGTLRDVAFASVSAPQGSIFISSDIATRFEIDRSLNPLINDQELGLQAAGNVEIRSLAAEVVVRDAPLAGGAARAVRFATSEPLPVSATYDAGQAGVVAGQLQGVGAINSLDNNGANNPFFGLDVRQGDLVLVKDEGADPRRNGIYTIARVGGGEAGFTNWLLERADDAASEVELPSGTFVNVREGSGSGYYQIQYVPSRQQIVEVSRRSELTVDTATLYGLEPGVRVSGEGIVSTAEVSGIDWQNRVVTLGLPAGSTVRAISAAELRASLGDTVIQGLVGDDYSAVAQYVGLELFSDTGTQSVGADHPLVQAVNAAGQLVRMSSRSNELGAFAEAYGGRGNILVLTPDSIGTIWQQTITAAESFTVYPGFTSTASDGRTLNPAVRSQLLTLPIDAIQGNTITVSSSFFRWDVVVPGQRISGDGLSESARVVSVSPATRTVVLSEGALPANFPQQVSLASSVSPNALNFDEYEQIYLDPSAVTADELSAIQPGMLIVAPGVAPNAVVVAVSVDRAAIAVAPGAIESWGTAAATITKRLSVVETGTGRLLLGDEGAPVIGVVRSNSDLSFTDSLILQVDSGFNDLDFARLRLGMSVSGLGLRAGAKLLSIDTATRTVGITPGSIVGPVASITFHNPVYDVVAELESGRLSLMTDGGKTLEDLVNEGAIPETLTATVAGSRTSTQNVGTFSDELYRLTQSDQDATELPNLVQEARTRFLDDTEDKAWQQNVVLAQDVVSDLVQFDAVSLDLADGEEIQDLVIADRAALSSLPAYVREGTGTRVTAVVTTATNELVVRRFEHVGAVDEFVTQSVSSEVELADWSSDGVARATVLNSNTLVVAYKTAGTWREVAVSGLASTFNLLVAASVPKTETSSMVVFDEFGTAYYPSLPAGAVKITAATHMQGENFLIAYSVGDEYVVKNWNSTTGYGTEIVRTSGEPQAIALTADGNSLAVGMGVSGVAIFTDLSTTPRRTVTYDLAESIDGVVTSPFTGAWGELAFVDAAGSIVTLQEIDKYDRSQARSRVVGVDYRTGIISVTAEAVGVGDDLAIEQVGDSRYAIAPTATLAFFTEAELEPRAVRYDDGGGAVDTGTLREVAVGRFEDGYVVVEEPIGAAPGDTTSDVGSLWKTLSDQIGTGGYVYAKNAQGQWVYFAQLTGVNSYNRLLGFESARQSVSALEQLRNITHGSTDTELMVAATHAAGIDYRVLPDGSQIRLDRVWPDDLAEAADQVDRWQGNEVFFTVLSERPRDGAESSAMFTGTQTSTSEPVTLAATFLSGSAVKPGMVVTGDGIDPNTTTNVVAVDLENNIVWLNSARDLAAVGDAPAGRFLQFAYSVDRPDGLVASEQLGTITATEGQSNDQSDFSAGRLVTGIGEIQAISSAAGTNQLQKLVVGMDVLQNYEATVAGGGAVTGVDWRIGLVGVSAGVVLDNARLETPAAHLVQFADRNGDQAQTFSVDVELANSQLAGRRGGLTLSVGGIDGGPGSHWTTLGIGGDVYLELPQSSVPGDQRELVKIGVLQGYDAQLGQIYLSDQTSDAEQLLAFKGEAPPRLILLDAGLSFAVNSGLVPFAYNTADPLYSATERATGRPVNLVRVATVGSSFSTVPEVTRLAVSTAESRDPEANWIMVETARNTSWLVDGEPLAGAKLTLAEMARFSGRSLVGTGLGLGSSVAGVGLAAEGLFLDSNFGVADGESAEKVTVSAPISFQNETSGLIYGSYTTNGQNGDLLSVRGYGYLDHLVAAFDRGSAITVSAIGDQSTETGAWLKTGSAVIGLDAENSIIVLEPGVLLTNDTGRVRFFIDGIRAEVTARAYLAGSGGLPAAEYLPDAIVGSSMSGIDSSGIFTGVDVVSIVLERDGIDSGTFDQRRFSSFHRLELDGATKVFRISAGEAPVFLGNVVGVDAENMLVSIKAADANAVTTIAGILAVGDEIRFQVDGDWLEDTVGGEAIKPAVVQSFSIAGDRVPGSLFDSVANAFVTRLTVTDHHFPLSQVQLGDLVTDDLGFVAKPVLTSTGDYEAVRVVGVDPVNRMIAIAWTDASGAIVEQMPALVESLGLTSITIASETSQIVADLVGFEVAVSGARRQVAGLLSGDLLRIASEDFTASGHLLGRRLEPMTGSEFGVGGEILGSTGPLGLISVTPGVVVSRVSGPVQVFGIRAEVADWSEGERSASPNLPNVVLGSVFNESRGIVETSFRSGQLTRANMDARAYLDGSYVGRVTGLDPAIGLIGLAESVLGSVSAGDILDIELTELKKRGDYSLNRDSVIGTFTGTRLLAQVSGFSSLSGNPIDPEVIEVGMPVWDQGDALIAYVTGVARVNSTDFGDAFLIGLTANAAEPNANGSMIPGDVSLIDAERIRFGGQLSVAEGGVIDSVAELGLLDGRMAVETSGDLAATAPPVTIFHGLSGPRVTVIGQFPNTTDLLGASVVGSGVPADTVVTGYDAQLGLLGLSNPVSLVSGSLTIEITPVESLVTQAVTVGDFSSSFVGDLNSDVRLILADSVVLPLNAEPWLGRQMALEMSNGATGTAIIRGIDIESRLVAYDWVNQPGNLAAATLTDVTVIRGAVIGHSGIAASGSDLDLANKTVLFVDPSGLSYLQTSVDSREFQASVIGQAVSIQNVGSTRIETGMFVAAAGLSPWSVIDSVQTVGTDTQITLRDYWTGQSVTPPGGLQSVLLSPFVEHDVTVGDSLSVASGAGEFNRFTVQGIDRQLGLLVVADQAGSQDRNSVEWLLSEDSSSIRVVAEAPLTSFSGPLGPSVSGEQHAFENARFILKAGVDLGQFFLGQKIEGTGLTLADSPENTLIVTGIDATNRLLGIGAAGGSVSTQSREFFQTVVDADSSGQLNTLFVGLDRLNPETASRSATPTLLGSGLQPTALLNIGKEFPFAWLQAAIDQIDGGQASQEILIEGHDAAKNIVFSLSTIDVISYDPRLGMLQLNYAAGYDLTSVTSLRVSVTQPVDVAGVNFEAADLSYDVNVRSFSVTQPTAPVDADYAHRIYVNSPSSADLSRWLGAFATVSGPGLRGQQRVTSIGADQSGVYLTVAAGGIAVTGGPSFGDRLNLFPEALGAGAEPLAVSVIRVQNYLVGQVTRDVVRVDDSSENSWKLLTIGGNIHGSGVANFGEVVGYDAANKLLFLEVGATASAEQFGAGRSEVVLNLLEFRSAPIGSTVGDTVVLRASSTIDLDMIQIGDRVTGDGIVSNTRVVGLSPSTGTISLTAGGVENVAIAGSITVVRTTQQFDVDANQTTRNRGTERAGVIVRLVSSFEQYGRLSVGQKVAGDGLSSYAIVEGIDADNRLVFLSAESVTALSELDALEFVDSDGEFTAIVSKLSDGTPQATFGLGMPGSTIVGQLQGDIVVLPESSFRLFRDYGTSLLGTAITGGIVPAAVPVLGYDAVTGVLVLPQGSVQRSAASVPAADFGLSVAEGLAADAWEYVTINNIIKPTEAKLSFADGQLVSTALVAVRPGQIVAGIGINQSAIVDRVDPVARELWIKSRDGNPVITLHSESRPRQITFNIPTTLELGATTTDGTSRVKFDFDEFGQAPIQVGSRAVRTIAEVGPATDQPTQLASRSGDKSQQREAWASFANTDKDQIVQGTGIKPGTYAYRTLYTSGETRLQLYNGSIYRASQGHVGDYEVIGSALPSLGTEKWYIDSRAVSSLFEGGQIGMLGAASPTTGAIDWVGKNHILGTISTREGSIDHALKTVEVTVDGAAPPPGLAIDSLEIIDIVIGSPFESQFLADGKAFTAANVLASDITSTDAVENAERNQEKALRSTIQTNNAQGTTRFVVGGTTGPVNNLTSRSLGKMISVWKATASAGLVDLADPNPAFTFQFDSGVTAPIVLEQQLPTLSVPIMVDGQNRYGATVNDRVVIDGSVITLNEAGQTASSYADEGVYGLVFENFGSVTETKKQAGVRGLNFVGFAEGAAVRLSNANNILVADNNFGFDADDARRSNRQGVRIDGNSQFNTVYGNVFAGSDDTAVIVTDFASDNFIVANTIGLENVGNNRIGVHLEADSNYLGLPAAGFDAVLSSTILLEKYLPDDPVGYRVIKFTGSTVDLTAVTAGMRVILESYPQVAHKVVGVDLMGRQLAIQEELVGSGSAVNNSLQQLTATIGYKVSGEYNENLVKISAETYGMVSERLFVGQAVSGPDIPAGTTIIGIRSSLDGHYEITLSNRLLGFGYDVDGGGCRLIAFGNQAPNIITQSSVGVMLGVGWEHAQLAIYDGFLSMLEDPDVAGRAFTGWDIISRHQETVDKFYAVFSVYGNSDYSYDVSDSVYRVPVTVINEENGTLEFDDVLENENLEKWEEGSGWSVVAPQEVLATLLAIESVSVTFMSDGIEQRQGGSVVGNEIVQSYEYAVKLLDNVPNAIGDARGAVGVEVATEEALGTVELSSWAIEVEVPPGGGNEVAINESQLEILRRMLQDWRRVERDGVADPDPVNDGGLDFSSSSIYSGVPINVYGYGVKSNVTVKEVEQVGGVWKLRFDQADAFNDDHTGSTTLSFGIGWYVNKALAMKGLRISDEVVSRRQGGQDRIAGIHLPEFTEVREFGPDFVRLSTPIYGQRIEYTTGDFRGVEGFQPKSGVPNEAIELTNGGSGYAEPPIVTISPPDDPAGVRAQATCTVVGGVVVSIAITNPGSGYYSSPTVTFEIDPANVGSAGEGAAAEVVLSSNNPNALSFISSRFGNVIADNEGTGVEMTPAAAASLSSLAATSRLAVSANVFGVLSTDAGMIVAENRGGRFDPEVFRVMYGLENVAQGASVPPRRYVNDWDKRDQFGNKFAEEDFAFVIELPSGGVGAGDRPTFWYL